MTSILSRLSPIPYFPAYPGPYEVGTLDLELPVSSLVSAGLSPACPSHSDIPTLQFRVFYPAALKGEAKGPAGDSVNWVPSPRKEYVAAYCRFAGASEFLANVLSYIPRHLYYIKLPAHPLHPLLPSENNFPVVVFSHGLGGTRNTYSYITAALAAQGCIVFCLEHRDGSAPSTFVRVPKQSPSGRNSRVEVDGAPQTPSSSGSDSEESQLDGPGDSKKDAKEKSRAVVSSPVYSGSRRRIDYTFQAHEISPTTAAIRNKQLEIRLWEIGALYAFIQKFNNGWEEAEVDGDLYLHPAPKSPNTVVSILNMFKDKLEVSSPGSITWAGHSFGAATITQFVKSVWYHPLFKTIDELKEPLYTPVDYLLKHFHPDGTIGRDSKAPVTVLLDAWCLPLLGERTRALWKRPLPGPTLGVLSTQFYKWKENLRGFRHVMNRNGGMFEPEWFKDVAATSEDTAPGVSIPTANKDGSDKNEEAIKDEVLPQIGKLKRSTSLDVTPQLPTGFKQGDEETLREAGESPDSAISDDEKDIEEMQLKRTRSRKSQLPVAGQPDRRLYYATKSAHMSQSDFGILFPTSAKYLMGVEDSEGVLGVNVRAVTEFLREHGHKAAPYTKDEERDGEIFGEGVVKGWEAVSLELGEEGI